MTPRIIVDKRELRSSVAKHLDSLGADMEFDTISVGDYILSRRVGVERKATDDFLKSWLDEKKIWSQLKDLSDSYENPLLIIEGYPDSLYTSRQIHPAAVDGVLRSIMVSMRIPIIWTMDAANTAQWLFNIAMSEQDTEKKRFFSWHGKRSHLSPKEQREYIVSAVTDVGPSAAKILLEHFGSVSKVFSAEKDELTEVKGIGPKTASKIIEIVRGDYQ